MKSSSLSVLLLLASLTAQADVSMVAGYVYDTGKGSYSSDGSVENRSDTGLCWAATSANAFQHWQDWYLEWYTKPEENEEVQPMLVNLEMISEEKLATIPDGYAETSYTKPGGTQSLAIYQDFLANFKDDGGMMWWATEWYFNGKDSEFLQDNGGTPFLKQDDDGNVIASDGGYLPGQVDTYSAIYGWHFGDLAGMKEVLDMPFYYAGSAVYLGIITPGGGGHAITCWGYETDADGNLNALYITDSDDRQYGARRVELHEENGEILLSSPFPNGNYTSGAYTVQEISFIANGNCLYVKDGNFTILEVPEDGLLDEALDITGQKLSSPTGLTTLPQCILASSGGKGTSLTLGGGAERVEGNGFTALAGSMVSLNNAAVRISGFEGGGISVGCEVNLCGGSVSVSGNGGAGISVKGTEADPRAYLRMNDNRSVAITGNDGGALYVGKNSYNAALVQHNGTVTFSGNGATAQDAVIYNGGSLSIADNGSVTFSGNSAKYDIYNDGKLTLVANEGQRITFQHGIKNSKTGTATLGAGEAGTYAFKDGGSGVSITLANATIAKEGGMLWDAEDCTLTLSDVAFSGDVTFNLGYFADGNQLDLTGATFTAGSTVSFILDLGSEAGKGEGITLFGYPWADMEEGSLTQVYVNLGDYFTGDTSALDGVNLALTVTGTIADDAMLIIDTDGFDLDRKDVDVPDCIYRRTADGKHYYNAPEPATATLSLLALAALCARRRRSVKY